MAPSSNPSRHPAQPFQADHVPPQATDDLGPLLDLLTDLVAEEQSQPPDALPPRAAVPSSPKGVAHPPQTSPDPANPLITALAPAEQPSVQAPIQGKGDPAIQTASRPLGVSLVWLKGIAIVALLAGLWVLYQVYERERRLEQAATQALAATSDLAMYRLEPDLLDGRLLRLTGKVPNETLRRQAKTVVQAVLPATVEIDNDIQVVALPEDLTQTEITVNRLTLALNQLQGVAIAAKLNQKTVTLTGVAPALHNTDKITQTFMQVPGVEAVKNRIQLQPLPIAARIYFDIDSATVAPIDADVKLLPIKQTMQRYPMAQLRVMGYRHASEPQGQALALQRALAVTNELEQLGLDRRRMQPMGYRSAPPDIQPGQPAWLSRCVLFEWVTPASPSS